MNLDERLLRWAVDAVAPEADVIEVRGLRDGGSPWLLRLRVDGNERGVVLRVGQDPEPIGTEVAALDLAQRSGVPAPRLIAGDPTGNPPVVLIEPLAGSSTIPPTPSAARLWSLGAAAAALHAVPLSPSNVLPRRERPIAGVDFAALRCDAALCYGPDAVDHVLRGWEEAAGRPAEDVAYWDVVAALSTPPDMDWFVGAIAGQGRADLDRQTLVRRRDEFLGAALDRLTA